jgi:alkylation response protein AidB-like acyl-CoA dehydrogenase
MRYAFTEEQLAWREEVRAFIRAQMTPGLREEMRRQSNEDVGPEAREFQKKLLAKGWWGLCWPKEFGGMERSAVELFIFIEEMTLASCPYLSLTYTSMGPTIVRVGTEGQKRHWLPQITRGEIEFAAGYSEPEAGTDLASLRTRADLDGDQYVVNGQKTWNTGAHSATHQWLAVRTDQQAKKHQGISLLIVPMDAPGITVQPIYVWPGLRTNAVFFDNVRVPKENLIGTPGMGFYYIAMALDFERIAIGSPGMVQRMYGELVELVTRLERGGRRVADDPAVRRKLAGLEVEIEVARLLALQNAWAIDQGGVPTTEASMAKIFVSELSARFADAGLEILGAAGQLAPDEPGAPLAGRIQWLYRIAPMLRFGGGTNEVQRIIIAQRGLGLPR